MAAGLAAAGATAVLATGCGGSGPPTPGPALAAFTAAWSRGDWPAMARRVADPPADFRAANAAVFSALGVTRATVSAGRIHISASGHTAHAPITERYAIPQAGTWTARSTVDLVLRHGAWRVSWTPATIVPALRTGDTIAVSRVWPARAPILGARGARLSAAAGQVIVGVVGSRIKDPAAVRTDLGRAGATGAEIDHALAAARASPDEFEPVFTVSAARFAALKAAPGSDNVYQVPGTEFHATTQTTAITPGLSADVVGSVGPITAEQLKALGAPYTATSQVGQSGLEASQERRLAGTPAVHVDVDDSGGNPVSRLATFPGHPGAPVRTSIDPRVQRAAEAALATSTRPDVAMVAMRASTGQVLAVASRPLGGFDGALDGAYPPGSSFKILTSTMLFEKGLSPSSPASCPPTIVIDGETFHNAEGDQPVSDIDSAFTESCNTAFIGLATQHLSFGDLPAVAERYGLVRSAHLGLPSFMDNIPRPTSETELAGDSIGQGDVTFSPLGMADVAASVDSGTVRAPRLVAGLAGAAPAASRLPAGIVAALHGMMAGVVTSGTAAGQGLPSGTYAKTGTAEYGRGPESSLKIDGWLVGFRGDLAFAIVTHDTGGEDGGPVNGPIIARFLDALG
jgi:hypothetical protein